MTYNLGAAIRRVIQTEKRTYRDLRDLTGVSHVTISRWSTSRKTPRVTEVERVLAVMGYGLRVVRLSDEAVIPAAEDDAPG